MPSVASEANPILPPRPHLSSARSPKADSPDPATPFAELLDSAPASEPPPPRQAQADRPERPDRADSPKQTDDRSAEAKAAKDSANDARDSKAADGDDHPKTAKDSKDGKSADASKETKDAEAATSADAGVKPKPDAEQSAALDAMFVNATTPVVTAPAAAILAIPQQLAAAVAAQPGTPEAEALAALQAAGQGQRTDAATKPAQTPSGKQADTSAKGAAPADTETTLPQIEIGKDAQARGNGDKAPGEFRRAVADLLTKLDTDVPSAQLRGDSTGAVKAGADMVQNLGMMTPAHATNATANAATVAANAPAQAAAVPLSGLAVEIATQASSGKNHFEIRLDPPELGRINVKIDVDRDGNVNTRLVVDRADTLDLLKRDSSSLERALQQAGLKTSDNALEFSLRQQGFAQDDTAPQHGTHVIVPDDDPAPLEALRQGYGRLLGLGGGLDIRV